MGLKVKNEKRSVEEEINAKLADFGLYFEMPSDDEIKKSIETNTKKTKKETKKETKNK